MIKKIKVKQLKPGMFIDDFNSNWLDHPFFNNSAKVKDEKIIEKIAKSGIQEVYIDTEKGLDVTDAPAKKDVEQEIQEELNKLSDTKLEANTRVPLKEEIVRARKIMTEAVKTMQALMEDVKLGKQIEIKQVEHIVENMTDSIFHNKDALISLSRIKQKDEYTYMHSLSVCALLIAFADQMNFNYTTIHAVGVGGLLHDIGKVKIENKILNKKGALSEEEFEEMKEHVKHGCLLMEQGLEIAETSVWVTAQHHERLNGTGYPGGLKGGEISNFGQMAAIVDVYDALTSDRCYRDKMHPTEALRKLFEWSDSYFNKELVEQFIRCVGIYPVGSLVRLASDLFAVVLDHNEKSLLHPKGTGYLRCKKREACYTL